MDLEDQEGLEALLTVGVCLIACIRGSRLTIPLL